MRDWSGKRVVIMGLARQGQALIRFFIQQGADVTVNDRKTETELHHTLADLADLPLKYVLGSHPQSLLDGTDALFISAGIPVDLPLVQQAQVRGIEISNDSQLFLERCPARVIGITGSAGKSTTTTLVGRMAVAAQNASTRVWMGGNIGHPLLQDLELIQAQDLVVMELSSFQLEIMSHSPQVAALLNISPNHLDRHHTMAAYQAAKARILQFQNADDSAVLGLDNERTASLKKDVRGHLIGFGRGEHAQDGVYIRGTRLELQKQGCSQPVYALAELELRGAHNQLNAAAACAIAFAAGLDMAAMQQGLQGFRGIPHRLEFVRHLAGADWYNDSMSTAPERSIVAIEAFDETLVLLAGGRDKDLPWQDFARLVSARVDHLILFGEAAELIQEAVLQQKSTRSMQVSLVPDLGEAVQAARAVVKAGDVVLLSPGGTSFDEYEDFAARGDAFKEMVLQL